MIGKILKVCSKREDARPIRDHIVVKEDKRADYRIIKK